MAQVSKKITFSDGSINGNFTGNFIGNFTGKMVGGFVDLEERGEGTEVLRVQAPVDLDNPWTMTLPVNEGVNGQYLKTDGTGDTSWDTPSGAGDVLGPGGGATDNAFARFDGVGGGALKNSPVTSDDSGNVVTPGSVTAASFSGSLNPANLASDITRAQVAAGTINHVIINNGTTGDLSSEATLAKSRGGTGADNSSVTFPTTGVVVTEAGSQTLTNKTLTSPVLNTGVSGTAVEDTYGNPTSSTKVATSNYVGVAIQTYVSSIFTKGVQDISGADGTVTVTPGSNITTISTGASNRAITLPSASLHPGDEVILIKTDTGVGTAVISDGIFSFTMRTQNMRIRVRSTSAAWVLIDQGQEYYTISSSALSISSGGTSPSGMVRIIKSENMVTTTAQVTSGSAGSPGNIITFPAVVPTWARSASNTFLINMAGVNTTEDIYTGKIDFTNGNIECNHFKIALESVADGGDVTAVAWPNSENRNFSWSYSVT